MKLIRFGAAGKEKPGVLVGEKRYDVSSIVSDYNEAFFEENDIDLSDELIIRREISAQGKSRAFIRIIYKIHCVSLGDSTMVRIHP